MSTQPYQVGHLLNPSPDDPDFTEKRGAYDWARNYSNLPPAAPIGVRQFDTELIAIAYKGELFTKSTTGATS